MSPHFLCKLLVSSFVAGLSGVLGTATGNCSNAKNSSHVIASLVLSNQHFWVFEVTTINGSGNNNQWILWIHFGVFWLGFYRLRSPGVS
jgi:hypothetical protein